MTVYQTPIIEIWALEIQELAKKYHGVALTDKELEAIRGLFSSPLHRVDDGGWEGCLAPFVKALSDMIGAVLKDHRSKRNHEGRAWFKTKKTV